MISKTERQNIKNTCKKRPPPKIQIELEYISPHILIAYHTQWPLSTLGTLTSDHVKNNNSETAEDFLMQFCGMI